MNETNKKFTGIVIAAGSVVGLFGLLAKKVGWNLNRSASGYQLTDGIERHAQNPLTFEIPSTEDKLGIVPGDFVKVIFESPSGAERMWIKITDVVMVGEIYHGTLANNPLGIPGLGFGDEITVENKHVIDILKGDEFD